VNEGLLLYGRFRRISGADDPNHPAVLALVSFYALRVQAHRHEPTHEGFPTMKVAVQGLHLDPVHVLLAVAQCRGAEEEIA
jgi:hypothetical protein